MRIKKSVLTAIKTLRKNLMRASLTALGIVIGIASVIVMMEIGQGSSKTIQSNISSMGANSLMIVPGAVSSGGVNYGAGSNRTLSAEDAEAIAQSVPLIEFAAPTVRAKGQITYLNKNWIPQEITGTSPEYFSVRGWQNLAEGEIFSQRDVRNSAKVAVIGQTTARGLFENESALGKEIRIANVSFRVVGVLGLKGANMMGQDQDDVVLAPWTTIKYRVSVDSVSGTTSTANASNTTASTVGATYPSTSVQFYPSTSASTQLLSTRLSNVDRIMASTRKQVDSAEATEQISALLRERHRLREGEPNDFDVRSMAELSNALSSTAKLMTTLLLSVAFISLMVGGVGIMNIMLVSVTERTREIGLRMAVGAKAKDILSQFLIEAILLCTTGGILGIVLGKGVSLMINTLLGWPTATSIPAIVAAFVVSVSVGIAFGYYPAAKASRLDPIEALRYE